jgi:hypothetical protein
LVDLDRAGEVQGFVGSDVVEDLPIGLGLDGETGTVPDLQSVEVLVLQRPERAFLDTVLARALTPGTDVQQLRPGGDETRRTCWL